MKNYLLIATLLMMALGSMAQKRVGDFIESTSYNEDKRGQAREVQYFPQTDGSFVCHNGENRFTRALYGAHSQYRLETSDRPVFALFQNSKNCRNIQFSLLYDGQAFPLDSVEECDARYVKGLRCYELRDSRWNGAFLSVDAACLNHADAALWRIQTKGFTAEVSLQVVVSATRVTRLHRNGDIGADKPGCFEAAEVIDVKIMPLPLSGVAFVQADSLNVAVGVKGADTWEQHLQENEAIASTLSFKTPLPWVNALSDALVFAADGAWDGSTWLHGAIGWRMPLAGWRAGYLGDVMGWNDRAVSHFNAYAKSQVTDVPPVFEHPTQDPKMNMARAEKKWGTQMYSNGYICRNPNRNDQMHHYDMNLNFIDELLWHFQYDADTAYMRQMWPVLTRHLAWEKRNFDSDGDGLYDAYCCIWASDALYYSGGAVTHSSAYNYRANLLAAKIARLIGEDGDAYAAEAEKILKAMNAQLWVGAVDDGDKKQAAATVPHWAEYKDMRGLRRVHDDAALWSIYTPIDCGVGTPEQMYQSMQYVTRCIPHVKVDVRNDKKQLSSIKGSSEDLYTLSTSDWMPYSWSINNVASAEVMNTALAYFKAGCPEEGYALLRANVFDQMYLGASPGNLGQISFLDAARGECYRDFSDNTGTSSRAVIQGLFGIVPQALDGQCIVRPGYPVEWDSCEVSTPYLSYRFRREQGKDIYEIRQHFRQPLQIVFRQNLGQGKFRDFIGNTDSVQTIVVPSLKEGLKRAVESATMTSPDASALGLDAPTQGSVKRYSLTLEPYYNANVSDIFRQEYRSPRPQTTTLQIPLQGIGEWCHPQLTAEINDSVFRSMARGDRFVVEGVDFRTPQQGHNIAFSSLWDNYPDSIVVTIPKIPKSRSKGVAKGGFRHAYLLMAGSTNHMETRIVNAVVVATYQDGKRDTLHLFPPYNWCPIEQDYFVDGKAFKTIEPRPVRVCLSTGTVSRNLGEAMNITGVYGREIPGGAAQMLKMPLNPQKKLVSLTLRTLSNDVVVGLMAVTLEN